MPAWPELLGPAEEVAPRLLGAVPRHGDVAVRLAEVEAYAGPRDPGSHAFRGPTPRSAVMFCPAGHLYQTRRFDRDDLRMKHRTSTKLIIRQRTVHREQAAS